MPDLWVVVPVSCGETEEGSVFQAKAEARAYASGVLDGASYFGGDECAAYVLPGDEGELAERSAYVQGEVERERLCALSEWQADEDAMRAAGGA